MTAEESGKTFCDVFVARLERVSGINLLLRVTNRGPALLFAKLFWGENTVFWMGERFIINE